MSVFGGLALGLLAACAPQGELSRAEQELVEWVRVRALPLEALAADELDPRALAPRELEGVRIVYLGEPDHLIHE